ncbi:MAG: ribonuclease R [Spirochaetaceae bacterium]|nr:ribonuclease R [Spirochaetaceae bacterium]|tara:strand:+ start:68207 stop:70423 length:2217 start_codon:yes stop_codon:yes gene_type:complete
MRNTETSTARILDFLKKRPGQKINLKQLLKELNSAAEKNKKQKSRDKGKRKSHRTTGMHFEEDPAIVLADLELLGLLRKAGSSYIVKKPFGLEAKISFSPSGLYFGMPYGAEPEARDLFIPPALSGHALPGDRVKLNLLDRKRARFEAEVTQVVHRDRKFYRMKILSKPVKDIVPGVLLDTQGQPGACFPVRGIANDTKVRFKPDRVVVVELSGKSVKHQNAYFFDARFVRFEDDTDFDIDFQRILLKYDLDPVYPELPVPMEGQELEPSTVGDWNQRKDLRDLYTITIDGADSKDFDDALSLEAPKGRGKPYKLYVHIADVSHFVEKGSPLDEEAQARATSYYLANRVVPMLPPSLSEELCSLVAGKNRLAFTAAMEIDPSRGTILKSEFFTSIIKVDRRYTYTQAEELLEGKKDPILPDLWKLTEHQRKQRMKSGRIDLTIPEPKFVFGEDDQVTEIQMKPRLRSSMLIEECMLSANIAVASFLRKKKANTLYRVHEPMNEEKLETLNAFFDIYKIPYKLKTTDQKDVQKALQAVDKKGPLESRIFNMLLLRSFMQAAYRPEPAGHWGLGFDDYAHFTSPIRRYPDLVVHRSLKAALKRKKQPYSEEEVELMGTHTSDQERRAMDAERDVWKLKLVRYIESTGKEDFTGFLTGFRPDRVFLEIEECPVEGIVEARHLTNDTELVLPDPFSVYIKKLSRPAFLGERWHLKLERVDIEQLRLLFVPVWGKEKRAFGDS